MTKVLQSAPTPPTTLSRHGYTFRSATHSNFYSQMGFEFERKNFIVNSNQNPIRCNIIFFHTYPSHCFLLKLSGGIFFPAVLFHSVGGCLAVIYVFFSYWLQKPISFNLNEDEPNIEIIMSRREQNKAILSSNRYSHTKENIQYTCETHVECFMSVTKEKVGRKKKRISKIAETWLKYFACDPLFS